MSTPTINWMGISGSQYTYWIHPIGTAFLNKPGNYVIVFAKEVRTGHWSPIYMGQSEDIGRRLGSHEKEQEAMRHGATHVHVHVNERGEQARLAEEKDLLGKWQCICNTQHV